MMVFLSNEKGFIRILRESFKKQRKIWFEVSTLRQSKRLFCPKLCELADIQASDQERLFSFHEVCG
jgi:hypothetical protein